MDSSSFAKTRLEAMVAFFGMAVAVSGALAELLLVNETTWVFGLTCHPRYICICHLHLFVNASNEHQKRKKKTDVSQSSPSFLFERVPSNQLGPVLFRGEEGGMLTFWAKDKTWSRFSKNNKVAASCRAKLS